MVEVEVEAMAGVEAGEVAASMAEEVVEPVAGVVAGEGMAMGMAEASMVKQVAVMEALTRCTPPPLRARGSPNLP